MKKGILFAVYLLMLLVSCKGASSRNAYLDSTWQGSWNEVDADRVVQDFLQSTQGKTWREETPSFSLGTISATDPQMDTLTLREQLGRALVAQGVVPSQKLRINVNMRQVPDTAFLYFLEFQVIDGVGSVLFTAERRIEKSK
jgi:hypothetical protein